MTQKIRQQLRAANFSYWPLQLSRYALLLATIVVALGAYTRLSDAGLGCPDWPGCYGFLVVPHSAVHQELAIERFPDAPIEHAKGWAEMIHRYAAGGLGVLVFALGVCAWRRRSDPLYPRKLSALLAGLVVLQALFGMWTVTLNLWPQIVTLHLLGGLATLTLLFLLFLRLRTTRNLSLPTASTKLMRLAWLAFILISLQVALGGWTSANYAAVACPDFPQCQQQWWPDNMALQGGFNLLQDVGPNYLGGLMGGAERVAIHVVHRVGALCVTIIVTLLCVALWLRRQRGMALTLWLALMLQVGIGIANVVWQFPLALALAHNTGATILLMCMVMVLCSLYGMRPVSRVVSGVVPAAITALSTKGHRYENSPT